MHWQTPAEYKDGRHKHSLGGGRGGEGEREEEVEGKKKVVGIPNNDPLRKAMGSGDSRSFILHLKSFVTSRLKSFPLPCHSSEAMPGKRHRGERSGGE